MTFPHFTARTAAAYSATVRAALGADPDALPVVERGTIVRGGVVAYLNDGDREEWAGRDATGRAVTECNTFDR
jgi:hypothetical protein